MMNTPAARRHIIKIAFFAALCLLLTVLGGCKADDDTSSKEEIKDYPVKIGEMVIAEMPDKVVSLSPSITEIIFALGSETKLYGVSDFCDYPPAVAEMSRVGTPALPDIDKILELAPGAVLTSTPFSEEDMKTLALQKIPVFVLGTAENFNDLSTLYRQVATILSGYRSGPVNGAATYERIRGKIDAITAGQGEPKVKSLYISALSPDGKSAYVATGATFAGLLVEAAGAFNIAKDVSGFSMTLEEIAAAAPDYIFCAKDALDAVKSAAALKSVPAVKNGKVTGMDSALMERQGERIVDAVRLMADVIVPKAASSAAASVQSAKTAS